MLACIETSFFSIASNSLFYKRATSRRMYIPHFVYSFIHQWTLGLFPVLGRYGQICFLKQDVHA